MTGAGATACPTLEELERWCAAAAPIDVRDHLESCLRCRSLLADLRGNRELLERLETLRGDGDAVRGNPFRTAASGRYPESGC